MTKVLGVPLSYFWTVHDEEPELVRLFHELSVRQRKQALAMLEELAEK